MPITIAKRKKFLGYRDAHGKTSTQVVFCFSLFFREMRREGSENSLILTTESHANCPHIEKLIFSFSSYNFVKKGRMEMILSALEPPYNALSNA